MSTVAIAAEKVGVQTLTFFDFQRKHPLVTEIMYPVDADMNVKSVSSLWLAPDEARNAPVKKNAGKLPLILFSHGDGGSRLDSSWFMSAMVKAGYIVASVDHYGNTWNLNFPRESLRRWERPQDISFVLKELLKHPLFASVIDSNRVGFAGFSLGGLTGIWLAGGKANLFRKPMQISSHYTELAFNSDQNIIDSIDYSSSKLSYYEPRIKAAFLMAPAYGFAFDQAGLTSIRIPVMIVAGESDQVVPIQENAKYFAKGIPGCLSRILGGKIGHFVFLSEPSERGKKELRKILVEDDPSVERRAVHNEVGELAQEFFAKSLK